MWIEYSQKKLKEHELDLLLLHINNCEICSEIKQGIDMMRNPASLNVVIENLNQNIEQKTSKKTFTVSFFRYISAAAVFVAVVGLAWYFANNTQPEIVINKLQKSLKPATDKTEIDTSKRFTINTEKKKIKTDNFNFKLNETTEYTDTTGIKKPEEKALTLNQGTMIERDDITVTEDYNDEKNDDSEKDKNIESKNLSEVEIAKPSSTKKENSKKLSKDVYPSNRYYKNVETTSEDDIDSKNSSNTDDLDFYNNALKLYNNNKYDSCLDFIDSKQILANSPYFENIQYLKAKSLVNLKRNNEAKMILNDLIKLKGTHYRKAKKLLKSIN